MALLGIYGPHAVGKTCAMGRLLQDLEGSGLPVTVICADNNLDRWWDGDRLVEVRHKGRSVWKGKQPGKRVLVDNMIADDARTYVVESARFYSGLHQYIAELYVQYGGGVHFIHPVCGAPMFEAIMRARSKRAGKRFKDEYWTPSKLYYESWSRHTNLAAKYFDPVGLPYNTIEVHEDYGEWSDIDNLIWRLVSRWPEEWYEDCPN